MNDETLSRRLERLLGPEGMRDVGIVESADGELILPDWLEQLASAAAGLPLADVPPVVTQDLLRVFEVAPPRGREQAVLVRDTRTAGQLAGVRGSEAAEGWSMIYTSAVADVVLDVWPKDDGTVEISGQVMEHRELGTAYRASATGPIEATVAGDRLGRFQLPAMPRGTYELVVGNGDIEVALTADVNEVVA